MAKAKRKAVASTSGDGIISQEWGGLVPVSELKLHPQNPREGDVGAIWQSIAANKFYGALVVQKSTDHVLIGNHRMKAAAEHGMAALPVIWVDCDDATALKILVGDNRTAELASWNEPALAELLGQLQAGGGLQGTGFDSEALDDLLSELAGPLAPEAFKEVDEGIETEHVCPRCGYRFSGGKTAPKEAAA